VADVEDVANLKVEVSGFGRRGEEKRGKESDMSAINSRFETLNVNESGTQVSHAAIQRIFILQPKPTRRLGKHGRGKDGFCSTYNLIF
jgi:hypothetical protein